MVCVVCQGACNMLSDSDHLFHLNYAITLYNNEDVSKAAEQFAEFERLFAVRACGHEFVHV